MEISERLRQQIRSPKPDVEEFCSVITGRRRAKRVHLAELFADLQMMQHLSGRLWQRKWEFPDDDERKNHQQRLLYEMEYWHKMGYDYTRVIGGVGFHSQKKTAEDTAPLTKGLRGWADQTADLVQSAEDLERYPWPEVKDENFWMYEFVARHLPEGMGILACPESGLFEITCKLGYQTLCYLIHDQPGLVRDFVRRSGEILLEAYRRIVQIPEVVGVFQGDDMGYKSATMVSPDFLRSHILPWHKKVAELIHSHDKIYLLHSCGNLEAITADLIDEVKIDAKHSFEDEIMPVEDFARRYGQRVGVLGGVPVDLLARGTEESVRRRTRQILEACMPIGRYALGSGNSVTNYVCPENFLAMVDEGLAYGSA